MACALLRGLRREAGDTLLQQGGGRRLAYVQLLALCCSCLAGSGTRGAAGRARPGCSEYDAGAYSARLLWLDAGAGPGRACSEALGSLARMQPCPQADAAQGGGMAQGRGG